MLLTMASSSGSDVAVHATASEMPEVLLVAVAGICRNLFGIGAQHRANIGQQAWQSAGVRRTRLQALGDADLMGAIDRDLSVVAGNHRLGTQRLNPDRAEDRPQCRRNGCKVAQFHPLLVGGTPVGN
jgi:hypothetical protein